MIFGALSRHPTSPQLLGTPPLILDSSSHHLGQRIIAHPVVVRAYSQGSAAVQSRGLAECYRLKDWLWKALQRLVQHDVPPPHISHELLRRRAGPAKPAPGSSCQTRPRQVEDNEPLLGQDEPSQNFSDWGTVEGQPEAPFAEDHFTRIWSRFRWKVRDDPVHDLPTVNLRLTFRPSGASARPLR